MRQFFIHIICFRFTPCFLPYMLLPPPICHTCLVMQAHAPSERSPHGGSFLSTTEVPLLASARWVSLRSLGSFTALRHQTIAPGDHCGLGLLPLLFLLFLLFLLLLLLLLYEKFSQSSNQDIAIVHRALLITWSYRSVACQAPSVADRMRT